MPALRRRLQQRCGQPHPDHRPQGRAHLHSCAFRRRLKSDLSNQESCGNCRVRPQARHHHEAPPPIPPESSAWTTCPHWRHWCQYNLVVKNGRIVDTEALDGPTNHGLLCVKGRSASFDFVHSPQRLTTPLIRSKITGELEPASWDEALDLVARRFGEIKARHGGSAIAALPCARSANEDNKMLPRWRGLFF